MHARTLLWASEHMRFILYRMFPQCTSVSAYFIALNVRRFDISALDVIFSVLISCFDEEERISVSICRLWANVPRFTVENKATRIKYGGWMLLRA